MSRPRVLIALLVLLGAGAVALEWLRTEPIDWRPNYEHDAAAPRGARVLYTLLPDLVGAEPRPLAGAPFRHLRSASGTPETYFLLTDAFAPDSVLAETLLAYVAEGNTVFVGAAHLGGTLARRLELRSEGSRGDSTLHPVNPRLARPGGYRFAEPLPRRVLIPEDSARTTVLATEGVGRRPVYVRVAHGAGAFYVLSEPDALSNAALLEADGAAFAAAALAYLPRQPVVWDTRHKPGERDEGSVLRYLQEDPALAWAYYTALVAALLFVGFGVRRRQRPIPPLAPPPDHAHALAFARTVGRLHHQHGDDRRLAARMVEDALARLRGALHDPDLTLDAEGRDRIARVLAVDPAELDALAALADRMARARRVAPADLLALDRRLHGLLTALSS